MFRLRSLNDRHRVVNAFDRATPARRADVRQRDEVMPSREQVALDWIRDAAAVALATTSGATDAIGFLFLGGAFTSAMTGNLVLLGVYLGYTNAERAGHVAVSLVCFIAGCALGARIAGTPEPEDPIWPAAVTRALAVEAGIFALYAAGWWAGGTRPDSATAVGVLGLGAIALGIQSSTMQRFGVPGLNTTYLSGTLTTLVILLATGHRLRHVSHHLLRLVGLVGGGALAALLALHARGLAPVVQLMPLALVLLTAGSQARLKRRSTGPGEAHEDAKHERDRRGARMRGIETIDSEL